MFLETPPVEIGGLGHYLERYPEASGDPASGKLWVLGIGPFIAGAITNDLALLPGSGKKTAHGEIEP